MGVMLGLQIPVKLYYISFWANLRPSTKPVFMNITKSKLCYLLSNLFIVFSIALSSEAMAQFSGGAGGAGRDSAGGAGGLDSFTVTGESGSPTPISGQFVGIGGGGGGGGAGVSGGAGGDGLSSNFFGPPVSNAGGAGGVTGTRSGAGDAGTPGEFITSNTGGGGGGGGAVGAVVSSSSTNSISISGGSGGAGGASANGGGGGGGAGGYGVIVNSNLTYTNTGTISGGAGGAGGAGNTNGVYGGYGGNGGSGGAGAILNTGVTFNNSGTVTGGAAGVGGSGTTGSGISGSDGPGVFTGLGNVAVITNTGTISAGPSSFGILNNFGIGTLNNLQGAGNSAGALTFAGTLPTNYNIIINSPTSYGKLAAGVATGSTTFGIYAGSKISNGTYASVLSGILLNNLSSPTGTFGSATWLLRNSSGSIWDLIISGYVDPVVPVGPSVANTNQSLVNTASSLQGTYTLQNSVLANSFSYDCTVFGANDICVSAGGRNTQVQAANGLNNTSALLIAAYRPHPNYRIGAYADQNLSVSNPGGTVNLGNNTPLIGLFAAWNERLDGTGTEFKVSAAYGQKNTTITRSVVGSGTGASEAGSGSSTLNSQGTQLTAKYGFGVIEDLIVSPYVGVRYTQNNMAGYTEGTSSSVTAPLTYSALNTSATTALAGVGASYRVIPQVMTFASAGVETDTNTANGTYSATNTSIGALTPVNFNANPVKTRPTATVGAYYDIEKNQRIGITGIYRQEAYQAVSTTTVMATYTVGL
jgi:hypothetical protein